MCAQQVCGRPLHTLCASNTRHVWGPRCSRAMNQHIIRHSLNSRSCSTLHWDDLEAAMHLVRPGPGARRWSAKFDRLMVPRTRDALQARFRALGKAGVWRYNQEGEVVYEEWARAFLKEEWDGVSFGREDAERLLAMGEHEHEHGLQHGLEQGDEHGDEHGPEHGDEHEHELELEHEHQDEDEDERGTVRPEDSVSNIFMLTPPPTPRRSRVARGAPLPPVAEEEQDAGVDADFDALSFTQLRTLLLEAAGNLFDFKVHLDSLSHRIAHGERAAAEAMRDRCLEELRVLEGALDRAAVRELGIREAGRMRAPVMGAIWERLLGGIVRP